MNNEYWSYSDIPNFQNVKLPRSFQRVQWKSISSIVWSIWFQLFLDVSSILTDLVHEINHDSYSVAQWSFQYWIYTLDFISFNNHYVYFCLFWYFFYHIYFLFIYTFIQFTAMDEKRITSRVVIMHNRLELYDWFSHASLSLLFALCLIPIHCKVTNPFTVFNKHTTPIIPPSPFATISPPYTA